MCALATFERRQIKSALLESENFSYYLEQEPYMREIIDAYMASKFRIVLQLLDRHSARHLLDLQLNHHVKALTKLIKDRALVLYFGPFASIRLDSLADAFGLTPEETERSVVTLIQEGSIKGRVDSHNKVGFVLESQRTFLTDASTDSQSQGSRPPYRTIPASDKDWARDCGCKSQAVV
jgi:COP9 signalosome complex subunit 1